MRERKSPIFMVVKCIDSPDSQKDESNTEKFMETERLAKNNNACKYSCNSGDAAEAGCSSHGHMGKKLCSAVLKHKVRTRWIRQEDSQR